ncbi:exodeoxyribonuclease V subunit gamma, partial [Variovorax sp. HJSM1_2]|uniref:exodeoxyribonuclease V subunit gamma n=1 Tax=Variovorax sp. HJSM1_2 TaxID=3366263 RepID=UPI003BBD18DB
RAVLGEEAVPAHSPFDKDLLVWRLMRLLPSLLQEPVFEPLARFLEEDTELRKRYQLAQRLADLFDQYQVYRADWLADWAAGDDVLATTRRGRVPLDATQRWQAHLWRALLKDVGPGEVQSSRAAVHQRFMAEVRKIAADARPAGLPRRVLVFGISSLPQQALEVLSALGRWCQVLVCVHNPCQYFWSDIVADRDLLRTSRQRQPRRSGVPESLDDSQLHQHAHPLLAAWGKQGRDYIGLLDAHDTEQEVYARRLLDIGQRINLFEPFGEDCLLHQIQQDILELRPLAETQNHWPGVDPATDTSLRFHIAHSPQREVEVVHDQILEALAQDATLQPRDIIVMVPDVNRYAPHIQAVFGLLGPQDPRHLPFTVADQGQRHHDPLLAALEHLLALPQSRLPVSAVLDLLSTVAVRQRFGISEQDLPQLQSWISDANIRWGLHAEQRQSLELPPHTSEHNSWLFGLQRMLLGYMVGRGESWQEIEPLDEIGGLGAALVGPLTVFLEHLDAAWRALSPARTPDDWAVQLRQLLSDFFAADDAADGYTLLRLERALQTWQDACEAAQLDEPLPLSLVREQWLALIDQADLQRPFFGGGVTFATLLPMRAIPFRMVCMLGMNDGDYPRSRNPSDFDLMGQDYRPGDRSRREDDCYLFLEALLSARERLHISWVGRSIQDNSERPPSVLLAQLRDHVAAGWRMESDAADVPGDGKALLHALTVEHKLQPFDRAYFTGESVLFSYAHEWRSSVSAAQTPGDQMSAQPLPPFTPKAPLSIAQLARFVKSPAQAFFEQRLQVVLKLQETVSEDQEPFAVDALLNWQLQDELIAAQRVAVDAGQGREQPLAAALAHQARAGELPHGAFGALSQQDLTEPMDALFERYSQAQSDWPGVLPDEEIMAELQIPDLDLQFSDWLGGLRRNDAGERARLVLVSTGLVKNSHYRHDKILPHWIAHIAGHLNGNPLTSIIVSKAGTVTLRPLPPAQVQKLWSDLVAAWWEGMHRPLPLAVATGFRWLAKPEEARDVYERHDPKNNQFAEVAEDPYLAREWPGFDALQAAPDWAVLIERLLRPLYEHLSSAKKISAKKSANSPTEEEGAT